MTSNDKEDTHDGLPDSGERGESKSTEKAFPDDTSMVARNDTPPGVGGSKRDLALLTAAHAETHAQTAVYSFIIPYLTGPLNFDTIDLGILLALSSIVGGLLQGVHGWLSHWVKRKTLCGGGNIFVGVFLLLNSLASNFPFFGAARVAGSIAASPQHPVAASLMSDWYTSKKRGTGFSIHFSGGNVGTVIAPLAAGFLYTAVGWRETLMMFALPGIIIGSLVTLFLNDKRKAGTWYKSSQTGASRKSYFSVVRNTNALKLMFARAVTSVGRGLGIILTYVTLYLKEGLGFTPELASIFVTIMLVGSIFSPILGGRLADRIGLRRPIIIVSLGAGAAALALLIKSGHYIPAITVSFVLIGLAVFNEGSLSQALLSDITTEEEREGAFSLYFVISYTGGAVWGLLIAYIITVSNFADAFGLIIAANAGAMIMYSLVRERNFRFENDQNPKGLNA